MAQQPNQTRRNFLRNMSIAIMGGLLAYLGGLSTGLLVSPKTKEIREKIEVREREVVKPTTVTIFQPKEAKTLEKTVEKTQTHTVTKTKDVTNYVTQTSTLTSTITYYGGKSKGRLADIAPRMGDGIANLEELYIFPQRPDGGYVYFFDESTAIYNRNQLSRFLRRRNLQNLEFDYAEARIKVRRESRPNPSLDSLRINLSFWLLLNEEPRYTEVEIEEPLYMLEYVLDVGEKIKVLYSLNGKDYNILGEIGGRLE